MFAGKPKYAYSNKTTYQCYFTSPKSYNQYSGLQIRASKGNYTEKRSWSEFDIQSTGQDILLILWHPKNAHQSPSSVPVVGEVSWGHNRQPLFFKSILFLIPLKRYFLESEVNLRWTVLLQFPCGSHACVCKRCRVIFSSNLFEEDLKWQRVLQYPACIKIGWSAGLLAKCIRKLERFIN